MSQPQPPPRAGPAADAAMPWLHSEFSPFDVGDYFTLADGQADLKMSHHRHLNQNRVPSRGDGHGHDRHGSDKRTMGQGGAFSTHPGGHYAHVYEVATVSAAVTAASGPVPAGYCFPPAPARGDLVQGPSRAHSTDSFETAASSTTGSLLSPVQTERSDAASLWTKLPRSSRGPSPLGRHGDSGSVNTIVADDGERERELMLLQQQRQPCLVCLGPQCEASFHSEKDLRAHVHSVHTYSCNWAGCDQPSFTTRDGLVWHVKSEHLLVCPSPGCAETSFQSIRELKSHVSVAHPEVGDADVKDWQLPAPNLPRSAAMQAVPSQQGSKTGSKRRLSVEDGRRDDAVDTVKRKCQDRLRSAVDRKTKKSIGTPKSADSPTDLVRNRASKHAEAASFPMVFEHAVLPFLVEFMPTWAGGPEHVISVTRGRTPQARRISIMTRRRISRARRVMIAGHVVDLLPETYRRAVSFVFTEGRLERCVWARGLGKEHPDDICPARNPYFFTAPRMGDSIGIPGGSACEASTASLGPCLTVGRGSYWLANFHPFLEAYRSFQSVQIEHPSPQDRSRCINEAHDAIAPDDNFRLGYLEVTSGLSLTTTRVSHDPYWEENGTDKPLVVTDWALISADEGQANMLRRFPSETQPLLKEPVIKSVSAVVPGAPVVSSGRTSGYQRGQVCEIPAYVSGAENGTDKATREWFVEEPFPQDDEEGWIRGGIGVEGDSGAAVVDAETSCLVGQLWGRNRYWGPGPRQTFFTPVADIFDDIQEKCGQQTRPQLPQLRDDADRYAVYPSCRQCYDLRTYLDSRRSSRMSLQSMIMGGRGDAADQDQETSIGAISELATPRDYSSRFLGIEEIGSSFNAVPSPWLPPPPSAHSPGTPIIADIRSPYALNGDIRSPYALNVDDEDLYDRPAPGVPAVDRARQKKRAMPWSSMSESPASAATGSHLEHASKRQRAGG